jgi:ABC-type multidrug transport system fused ATPase/permease subunit
LRAIGDEGYLYSFERREDFAKIAKKKAEEEAKRAKEAEAAKVAEFQNSLKDFSYAAATEGIKDNKLTGAALTEFVQSKVNELLATADNKVSIDGAARAVLENVDDFTSKWGESASFGHLLKTLIQSVDQQVNFLYVLQAFNHTKNYPSVTLKSGTKRLLEYLFPYLLAKEIVDVDGILAWADDEKDNDYPGRDKALFQTTSAVATLRAALQEEESEVDSDEDFDAPQDHL